MFADTTGLATLAGGIKTVEEIWQIAHNTDTSILFYNNEAELSAVVNLCYLSARNKYCIEREDWVGRGIDDIFYSEQKNADGIILE